MRYAVNKDKILNGRVDRQQDVMKIPPIFYRPKFNEIIGKFGGAEQLCNAVDQLQTLLYAA